jgi:hypothetical protein
VSRSAYTKGMAGDQLPLCTGGCGQAALYCTCDHSIAGAAAVRLEQRVHQERGYLLASKSGQGIDGAVDERSIVHLLEGPALSRLDQRLAICGTRPGVKSGGWREHEECARLCPRCQRRARVREQRRA